MPELLTNDVPQGLLESSEVYTDCALNHISCNKYQSGMKDISATLKQAYEAKPATVVPGSGTFGIEAIAR